MKNTFLILLFAISLINCKAQHKQNTELMIPEIDNIFETFDVETFKKGNGNRQDEKNNEYYIIRTGDWKDTKVKSGYGEGTYPNNSYFMVIKNYFPNGNIDIKGIGFNNGSQYGIWYKFDEKGNLIEEINTDKGYDFSWGNIIKYCEKNKIELTKGYVDSGFQTTIYKEEMDGGKTWRITYQLPAGDKLMEITLDGKTGVELKRKELNFIGG